MAINILTVFHVLFAIGLVGVVLSMDSKNAGFGAALSGGGGNAGEQVYGRRKGKDEILTRVSTVFAILFILTSMILVYLQS